MIFIVVIDLFFEVGYDWMLLVCVVESVGVLKVMLFK